MSRTSNFSADTQEFLAVSARYLGLETDIPVACSAWAIVPTTVRISTARTPYHPETLGQRCA